LRKAKRAGTAHYSGVMPDVPGLVICRWCHLLGPEDPRVVVQLTTDLEARALQDGWRFEAQVDDWICPGCIERREKAEEN
jgi:hypothetical protein